MNLKQFNFFIILLFTLLSPASASTLPKGSAAWLYGTEETWVMQIKDYNYHAPRNRLNYLFPETGIIHIDSKKDSLLMTYNPSVTKFYKKQLKNVKILPDLSFWVAHTNFKTWPVKNIKKQQIKSQKKLIATLMQMGFF